MFNIYKVFNNVLNNQNISISKADVYAILEYVLKKDYQAIITDLDYQLTNQEINQVNKIIELLEKQYPLAYIIKNKYFYNHKFYVDKNVLIPRVESEEIINLVYDYVKNNNNLQIIDLCCGSGCLGISLALLNKSNNVLLVDIDNKALSVSEKNINNFNLKNAKTLQSNFLENIIKNNIKANVVVCNPPYIDINDDSIADSVKLYEPNIALFAKDNGLYFYKKLISNINKIVDVNNKFMIVLEFGWNQKTAIEKIINDNCLKYNWEFKKDNYNNWRNLIIKNF
ncbi:peptide chain release factor N(5)-glutamine methyltransferase [Mycoplasma sp. HU2014]|uniref:peptide chain release factor N(5)-glutamine methyltransferase n=1 Tax=Mycoplasma sp. HU2014 TaxID=1664275 RepID=UPI00067D3249|nr:peptide chain release factor N(5)-glutamine methyltransferase [Mycoplasma sp. HU2014]KNG79484.1 release factor specific glutamine methyltransferase [Mycoplasma sp. HU2014]